MKTLHISKVLILSTFLSSAFICCKKSSATNDGNTSTTATADLTIYKKLYGASSISQDGNFVVIKSNGLPDHKSPYYQGTEWAATLYEAYNGSNTSFILNPNRIRSQSLTFRIPLNPKEATSKSATPGGPIGVSLNGVPFFNQYAAMNAPLTGEINSFDQYLGHPQQQGQYHYHIEPTFLTNSKGKSALLGFLLDGFPVYGPTENNTTVINSQLDAYHGHTANTAEYPNGIYHYHITAADPYINGNGFYGTPGTVSN